MSFIVICRLVFSQTKCAYSQISKQNENAYYGLAMFGIVLRISRWGSCRVPYKPINIIHFCADTLESLDSVMSLDVIPAIMVTPHHQALHDLDDLLEALFILYHNNYFQ